MRAESTAFISLVAGTCDMFSPMLLATANDFGMPTSFVALPERLCQARAYKDEAVSCALFLYILTPRFYACLNNL